MVNILYILKRVFWSDKLAAGLIVLAAIFNIICWVTLRWEISPDQASAILHYNVFFGIDVLSFDLKGSYFQVLLAPGGGAIIWLINFILGAVLYGQVVLGQQRETREDKKNRARRASEREYYLDYFDAKMLASYLLWAGSLVVQASILIYVISIVLVNK